MILLEEENRYIDKLENINNKYNKNFSLENNVNIADSKSVLNNEILNNKIYLFKWYDVLDMILLF